MKFEEWEKEQPREYFWNNLNREIALSAWESASPKWVDAKYALPEEMKPCIVKIDGLDCPVVRFYLPQRKIWLSTFDISVTHWMELPE